MSRRNDRNQARHKQKLRKTVIKLFYFPQCFAPLHQFVFFPYCSLYTSNVTKKDYLFKNQEPLQLVIIVFILVTFMCDSGVILSGEIRCCTLLELKGLTKA